MEVIDLARYRALPNRDEYDEWLRAEGLMSRRVYRMEVDGLTARCDAYALRDGQRYLNPDGQPARCQFTVQLSKPPPLR